MVEVMELDLSSLASIRSFADAFHKSHQSLDALVNNAGVMALPYRKTVDGFEMQFGTDAPRATRAHRIAPRCAPCNRRRAGGERRERRASVGPHPLR